MSTKTFQDIGLSVRVGGDGAEDVLAAIKRTLADFPDAELTDIQVGAPRSTEFAKIGFPSAESTALGKIGIFGPSDLCDCDYTELVAQPGISDARIRRIVSFLARLDRPRLLKNAPGEASDLIELLDELPLPVYRVFKDNHIDLISQLRGWDGVDLRRLLRTNHPEVVRALEAAGYSLADKRDQRTLGDLYADAEEIRPFNLTTKLSSLSVASIRERYPREAQAMRLLQYIRMILEEYYYTLPATTPRAGRA